MTKFSYEIFHTSESPYLAKKLQEYNAKTIGEQAEPVPIGFIAKDKDVIIAGMFGWLKWGWLYLDLAWVDENYRGHGIGTTLLQKMESAALEAGASRIRAETGSFQALPFYLKHGFQVYAENDIWSADGKKHVAYLIRKNIDSPADQTMR